MKDFIALLIESLAYLFGWVCGAARAAFIEGEMKGERHARYGE